MTKLLGTLLTLALVLAACSPGASDSTSTTSPPAVATTGGSAATTTTQPTATSEPSTTTTQVPIDSNATVEAKTEAVLDALPDGWTGSTSAAVTDAQNEDFAYDLCLLPDDFDIDNLDDFTAAALLAEFEGPSTSTSPFPEAFGGIEARVFNSEAEAEAAFAVFERIWGTPEGLECMTQSVTALVGDEFPAEDLTFTTESVTVAGSQAGARFEMSFDVQGFGGSFFVEFQGARVGACTVIASFITFGEPFDRDVADAVFGAAINA